MPEPTFDPPFKMLRETSFHIVAGIHIGEYSHYADTDAVITVGATPGFIDHDGVHHTHQPVGYQNIDKGKVEMAADWVLRQVAGERTVTIRSERGKQRPPLVAGVAILKLGGYYHDVMTCLIRALPAAGAGYLTDFRCLNLLKEFDREINYRGKQ